MKRAKMLFILCLMLTISSCGGGGGGGDAAKKQYSVPKLILSTTGTPSRQLAGIGVTIELPPGVTPIMNGSSPDASKFSFYSSVAAPATVFTPMSYTPASGATPGKIRLVFTSNLANGFGAGEYARVTFSTYSGNVLTKSNFNVYNFNPVDILGGTASGLTSEWILK